MGIKVCKFGGTSVASATNIAKVREIIKSDPERRFVVVSAPGKRFKGDVKITDMLYECAKLARSEGTCEKLFSVIAERYTEIAINLGLKTDIKGLLERTMREIDEIKTDDFAASRGEYMSAVMISEVLGMPFVDAAEVVEFDANGRLDGEYTNDLMSKKLEKLGSAVIPGFYGAVPGDDVKTFSRGGSDITGALVARAVNATVYENWTDVNGFRTADPRIVKDASQMETLCYHELRELSYMGANVLHSESIFPVKQSGIPINIRNTFEPSNSGTMIVPDENYEGNGRTITGIAGKKGFTVITVEKAMMNSEIGFARKILTVLERYGVSLEHMPTGIDTISIVIDTKDISAGLKEKIITRIREAVEPDRIAVHDDIALIATVGFGMKNYIGLSGKLFSALGENGVNVVMIDQGSSEMNIIIGVEESDYEKSIQSIYSAFC